ncbi:hypothetical protein Leryth_021537, partial [Lithospermum erythrorhizon]
MVENIIFEIGKDFGEKLSFLNKIGKACENYQELFSKWSKLTSVFMVNEAEKERLTKENDELKKLVEILRNEVVEWESKVKGFEKGIRMMNSSTNVLDEILLKENHM